MDCLYAKCARALLLFDLLLNSHPLGIPCVTDCVMAELEKLGHRYRVALRSVEHTPASAFSDLGGFGCSVWPETLVLSGFIAPILALMQMIVLSSA